MATVEEMPELKNIMMIFLADSTQKMHATRAAKVSSVNLVKKRTRLEEEVTATNMLDRGPDAGPRVGTEEGKTLSHAGLVEDRGVGHDGAGGREDGHGLTAEERVSDTTDGGGEDHLSRAERALGGRGEDGAEGDGGREGGKEKEEDGSLDGSGEVWDIGGGGGGQFILLRGSRCREECQLGTTGGRI